MLDRIKIQSLLVSSSVRNIAEHTKNVHKIKELSKNSDVCVRYNIARNPNSPADILRELSKDSKYDVLYGVLENPNCPINILEEFSEEVYLKDFVAHNANCPEYLLEKLSEDSHWNVRYNVAGNPNCPINILEKLSGDWVFLVREAVNENISARENQKQSIAS